jgi:hypothetical protein
MSVKLGRASASAEETIYRRVRVGEGSPARPDVQTTFGTAADEVLIFQCPEEVGE